MNKKSIFQLLVSVLHFRSALCGLAVIGGALLVAYGVQSVLLPSARNALNSNLMEINMMETNKFNERPNNQAK